MSANLVIADGLAARSQAQQLRSVVRDMVRRAIRAHSVHTMRTCVDVLRFDLQREMGWVLRQVMRHDFAEGVDVALRDARGPLALPPAAAAPARVGRPRVRH